MPLLSVDAGIKGLCEDLKNHKKWFKSAIDYKAKKREQFAARQAIFAAKEGKVIGPLQARDMFAAVDAWG